MTPPGATPRTAFACAGVRIAGSGSCVPDQRMTNADFEKILDTSDEWIVQRTGIHERRRCDPTKGESTRTLVLAALRAALDDARMNGSELDLIIVATVTPEMLCPSVSCRVAVEVGAIGAGAFDLSAACSGFVYGLNVAHELIRTGAHRNVAVVGCDTMSSIIDYTDRGVSILFGDAAGAVVLRPSDDPTRGALAQALHPDGSGWKDLYLPRLPRDFPPGEEATPQRCGKLQMNGREVFKFAVRTFSELIQETLDKAGLKPEDVDHYVCHQSNARILEASRERFGIPEEKLYVNIDRYGNSSAGSVPLCFDELRRSGKIRDGHIVLFVAFGGGMTWASSLWRV